MLIAICKSCKEEKPLDKFELCYTRTGNPYYRKECKLCRGRKHKKYKHWTEIERKYGITKEDWENLYEQQNRKCAICRIEFSELKFRPHVDHCHETGKVRSLLCPSCNKGLGCFRDSPELCKNAAKYLEKHNQ